MEKIGTANGGAGRAMPLRASPDYCRRVQRVLDPFPLEPVDIVNDEHWLMERARERDLGKNVKFPDCIWHKKTCRYIVAEIKSGGNFRRAIRQLYNFAQMFPDLHERVKAYVIHLESNEQLKKAFGRGRKMGYRCEPIPNTSLCRPYLRLRHGRKQYLEVNGRPVYVHISKRL